jgi:hypothetical protein
VPSVSVEVLSLLPAWMRRERSAWSCSDALAALSRAQRRRRVSRPSDLAAPSSSPSEPGSMMAAPATSLAWEADSSPQRKASSSSGRTTTCSAASSKETASARESPLSPASHSPAERWPSVSKAPLEATRRAHSASLAAARCSRREKEADQDLRVRPVQQGGVELPHGPGQGRFEVRSRLAHAAHLLRSHIEHMFVRLNLTGMCVTHGGGENGPGQGKPGTARRTGWAGDGYADRAMGQESRSELWGYDRYCCPSWPFITRACRHGGAIAGKGTQLGSW